MKFGMSPIEIWNYLKSFRVNINVSKEFKGQVTQIDKLLSNDKTGLVSTIVDFMTHSSTVDMKIETKNDTLNTALKNWQTKSLNRNVNIDIPAGLRELSTEYFRERWRSSLLALKVVWGKEGKFTVPKKMWFLDGSAVEVEDKGALNTRQYHVMIDGKKVPLKTTKNSSIYIRKPYTSWHEKKVTPYLVKRGTLFNSLMKEGIIQKQSDVIEAILPIMMRIQSGSDALAREGLNPTKEQFEQLKQQVVDAKDKFESSGNFGDIIASLRHDTNIDYLIPELTKIFDEKIIKSTDKNILSSLGLIELQGFSNTREEAILNPKVLVEEVTDAVMDWANLLEDVMIEMMERNRTSHPTLANGNIQVIPGTIKAFITDEMRTMLRSMYDRGIISKQTASEDISNLNFEVQVNRREKEDEQNLQKTMQPPVIQNLEQYTDPDLEDQNKKPGTPEADNFNNAILKNYKEIQVNKKSKYSSDVQKVITSYNNIDELPENIKSSLAIPAQILWMKVFNSTFEETGNEEQSIRVAWSKTSEKYEKADNEDKWIKKINLEDYKNEMSTYAYKLLVGTYETALDHSKNTQDALKTAMIVMEKVCKKNDRGIWVKDKTVMKSELAKLDKPDFIAQILDLEIKEKQLKLLNKLNNEDDSTEN